MSDAMNGTGFTERSVVTLPSVGSTVIREAFDAAFTLYFSDHSSLRITGGFTLRGLADAGEVTLSTSVADLTSHTSELTSLIGQTVEVAIRNETGGASIAFASGVSLAVDSDRAGV